jgi:hypothetical protein
MAPSAIRGWLPRRDAILERMPPSSGPWVAADLPDQQTMAISWALSHGIRH